MERPLEGHQSLLKPVSLQKSSTSPHLLLTCSAPLGRLGGQHVTDCPPAQLPILSHVSLHLFTEPLRWGWEEKGSFV